MRDDNEDPCPIPHRRSFWERHGSWVLLSVVAVSCLGVGLHIGVQVAFSQISQSGQLHAAELRELQLLHQAERADLTNKLTEVAKSKACAPSAWACQKSTTTPPQ